MKHKKPVPQVYYNEMVNELARNYWNAKNAPKMQQDRIDAVLVSKLDYEVMTGGNGHNWQVPLSKLYEFLDDAKKVDIDKLYKDWQDYKAKHYPVKGLKGNLRGAKIEAELKKIKNPKFYDNDYNYYYTIICRYYLSNKQSEDLMAYFMEIGIL